MLKLFYLESKHFEVIFLRIPAQLKSQSLSVCISGIMTLANLKLNICICVNFMIFFKKCKILLTKEKGELLGSPFFYTSG
jgi:hypothetical protein